MIRRIFSLGLLAVLSPAAFTAEGTPKLSFNRDIRPIFAEHCLSCHGPGKKNGGLRLDLEAAAKKGGKSGIPTVVAGKPEESELLKRIHSTDASEVMPPPKTNKVLKPEEKAKLKEWIAHGAPFEGHWAFEPLRKNPKLSAKDALIDRHILARLSQSGQTYRPEASRETLIRRVAFTLTGLPPTVAEVDQFATDTAPGAYERMVDRYFSSPRHGEEMARASMIGGADPHALVQALASTQMAVETVSTVRDKVVEAYQEILRMPV